MHIRISQMFGLSFRKCIAFGARSTSKRGELHALDSLYFERVVLLVDFRKNTKMRRKNRYIFKSRRSFVSSAFRNKLNRVRVE